MDSELKQELRDTLVSVLEEKISSYDLAKKSGNPFMDILFGDLSNLKSFIHSTATSLGSCYEEIAVKIAKSNPYFVIVEKRKLKGTLSDSEKALIKNIVKDLEENAKRSKKAKATVNGSDYSSEINRIYGASAGSLKETEIVIDLYLKTKTGKEFFIEMKGPDPNKKEVRAAKEDLLNVVAIKKREVGQKDFEKKVGILFGVYYNNVNGKYTNWKVSPIFEPGKGLLVQEEFWDFLGGTGTYTGLLEVIREVQKEIFPKIKTKVQPLLKNL